MIVGQNNPNNWVKNLRSLHLPDGVYKNVYKSKGSVVHDQLVIYYMYVSNHIYKNTE